KVVVGEVAFESIRHKKILHAIVVEIRYQGTPAPVGVRYAGELPDLAERPVAVVEVKHVSHVLCVQAAPYHGVEHVVLIDTHELFLPIVVLRQHIQGEYVHELIAVDVGDIGSHGELGYMAQLVGRDVDEKSALVVDQHPVACCIIATQVHIDPSVVVEIGKAYSQPVVESRSINTDRVADVREV